MTVLQQVSLAHVEFDVRRALESDAAVLAELRALFFLDQFAKGQIDNPFDAPGKLLSDTLNLIHRRRTMVFVTTRNGRVIGYVIGHTKVFPRHSISVVSSIDEIFVVKNQRRFNLAQDLVRRVMSEFRRGDAQRIELRVLAGNEEGAAFWKHLGFGARYSVFEYRGSGF